VRAYLHIVELPANLVDPGGIVARHERPIRHVQRNPSWPPGRSPVASANGTLGAVDRLQRSLGVDVRVGGQQEAKLAAAADQLCSHRASQPRHDRVEQLVGGRRGLLAPQRIRELGPWHGTQSVRAEVRKEKASFPARHMVRDVGAGDSEEQPSTELDPRLRQGFRKVTACAAIHNPRVDRKEWR
jgi:hypothetical protein